MTSQADQDVQDIRMANLEKDVAFYTAVVAMLVRSRYYHGVGYNGQSYPGDWRLDQQFIERVFNGELDIKVLGALAGLHRMGTTYARSSREARRQQRWERACGRARAQLQRAEEALQTAKAERGY